MLLLLQFFFDHSQIFTRETRNIVPPCNVARISNFHLECLKFPEFETSLKRYSSFSSYSIILIFFTRETRHIVPPCNKAWNFKFLPRIPGIPRILDFFEMLLLLQLLFDHSEFFYQRKPRHIVPPCKKTGFSNFHLEFLKFQEFQIYLKRYSSFSFFFDHSEIVIKETRHIVPPCNIVRIPNVCLDLQEFQMSLKCYSCFSCCSIILIFLPEKLGILCHPVTKPEFRISAWNSRNLRELIFTSNCYSSFSSIIQIFFAWETFFTWETRHIEGLKRG